MLTILYFSVHEILEYDDLNILKRAGHRVFSLGSYWNRAYALHPFRPSKDGFFDDELTAEFIATGCEWRPSGARVTREFCQIFDVVIINHDVEWLNENLQILSGIPIVYRSIGQSTKAIERFLTSIADRISVCRYSHAEVGLPGFAKTDAVIYFGKEITDHPVWVGGGSPITFHNNYPIRSAACVPTMEEYAALTEGFEARLFGYGSQDAPRFAGFLDYAQMGAAYAQAGCYVYVWSRPPSYTLSLVEAMLVGTPVVAPAATLVETVNTDPECCWSSARYEVPRLLADGCGFVYDTIEEGREQIRSILQNKTVAAAVTSAAVAKARFMFDGSAAAEAWNRYLADVMKGDM